MNTLFAKTLLWFIGTAALAVVALMVAAALNTHADGPPPEMGPPGPGPRPMFGAMLSIQLAEARFAYENGGPGALKATLDRFHAATGVEGVLTDSTGRDLVTGEDRSELAKLVPRRGERPTGLRRLFRIPPAAIARQSRDGRYVYFLLIGQRNYVNWLFQPQLHVTILLLLAALCYLFARHLTAPVRQLQMAVQRFGQGDLSARVRSERRDELGQLARTFDTMADRLETLLTAERRLLLDISHELRSPLARLGLAVELARSGGDPGRQLDRIQKEADRLNTLVGELLQVTRAEGDATKLQRGAVRLDELVTDIAADAAIEAQQRGSRVELAPPPAVTIEADAELIRRALDNVIRNAVRYAPEQTPVEIAVSRHNGNAEVAVRDYGPGVPEYALERIFQPFFRVQSDRDRQSGGVGLGLAIAHRAVELHQGTIRAENADPGLRVRIHLRAT